MIYLVGKEIGPLYSEYFWKNWKFEGKETGGLELGQKGDNFINFFCVFEFYVMCIYGITCFLKEFQKLCSWFGCKDWASSLSLSPQWFIINTVISTP